MDIKFFVPFETAKALKEKGFDEECGYYYSELGMTCFYHTTISNSDLERKQFAAPTYHEVVDWFESKGLYITAMHFDVREEPWTAIIDGKEHALGDIYTTREEALNAGILKALELI